MVGLFNDGVKERLFREEELTLKSAMDIIRLSAMDIIRLSAMDIIRLSAMDIIRLSAMDIIRLGAMDIIRLRAIEVAAMQQRNLQETVAIHKIKKDSPRKEPQVKFDEVRLQT